MGHLEEARRVLKIESDSILEISERLDDSFVEAVETLFQCKGKVVLAGMGKSGFIAQKISSTLSSTGTPSFFLHPAEGSHGDLGRVSKEDVIVAISNGGESEELFPMIDFVVRKGISMIAMTASPKSTLGKASQVVLNIKVKEEACPLGLAPTSSSTATLAIGDALAMALLKYKGFKEEDFAEFHPGGSLGRKLLTRVKDLMHDENSLPIVQPFDNMSEVISKMTCMEVRGVAGVSDTSGKIVGIITDGDIRRHLEQKQDPLNALAEQIMSHNPKTIDMNEMAAKALYIMEKHAIQSLFVVDECSENPSKAVGLIHLQDLIRGKIK